MLCYATFVPNRAHRNPHGFPNSVVFIGFDETLQATMEFIGRLLALIRQIEEVLLLSRKQG
jgi:hypothetical protein